MLDKALELVTEEEFDKAMPRHTFREDP